MNTNISNFDYVYIAGYIDGDGCFYIGFERGKKRLKPKAVASIIISSVDKDILDIFKHQFGGSIYLKQQKVDYWKPQYNHTFRKKDSVNLTNMILPYLTEKQDQAFTFLKFAESVDFCEQQILISNMKELKNSIGLIDGTEKEKLQEIRNSILPTQDDFAYLAGFIDAECCFSIQKNKPKNGSNFTYKIILTCNNSKITIFKWLLERFGGSINFVNREKYGHRNQFVWRLTGNALSQILKDVYPYLKYKKPVCKELIDFYATTLTNGGARHTEEFRSHYAEVIKIRERIINTVHELNSKCKKTI